MSFDFGRQGVGEADRVAEMDAGTFGAEKSIVTTKGPLEEESFIEIGDKVLISYNDEPTRQHTIKISETEHNPDMKIIRANMPLAQALIGSEINEEVEIPAGGKTRMVTIIGIQKASRKTYEAA